MDRFELTTTVKKVRTATTEKRQQIFEDHCSPNCIVYINAERYYAYQVLTKNDEMCIYFELDEEPPEDWGDRVYLEGEEHSWQALFSETKIDRSGNTWCVHLWYHKLDIHE